jgi:predicted nuclease of predicted toxin-antitoxin system
LKFVADESVDYQIVSLLREDGHEVVYIAETQSGALDDAVLTQANLQKAVLLTSDKDFGDLVFRQHLISSGIVLLRIAGLPQERKAAIVAEAISKHGPAMPGGFTVLTSTTIRIRPKDS